MQPTQRQGSERAVLAVWHLTRISLRTLGIKPTAHRVGRESPTTSLTHMSFHTPWTIPASTFVWMTKCFEFNIASAAAAYQRASICFKDSLPSGQLAIWPGIGVGVGEAFYSQSAWCIWPKALYGRVFCMWSDSPSVPNTFYKAGCVSAIGFR